ncbi:PREDICTED: 3-hydroxyisobutyryl-CoA hydrolase, mitochondrial-like [Polistes dominula]|uniref:3-hydroxyisobutyryl-CoA hydrolase, mitochondrial n=1 Tax=Polistes dominula TaxID=743375 RepID=A0ABM1IET3_POLDO|nr:PREDICTED: 3-hydroxyisobutyryl-CoA hydrolase, mitochondrial-like [Polistes dominula]
MSVIFKQNNLTIMFKFGLSKKFDIRRLIHKTSCNKDSNNINVTENLAKANRIWETCFWGGCENDIKIKDYEDTSLLTLDRPDSLNSLTPGICKIINENLQKWKSSKKLIIIEGSGDKAFCTGGYLKMPHAYRGIQTEHYEWNKLKTFQEYYSLGYNIGTLKVPFVALMNNVVMGLGSALSLQAKYRIVTERSIYAMPEVAIGYFPDGTACYTFPRLQNHIGHLLGITGYKLKGIDIVHSGIASHFVPSDKLEDLKYELIKFNGSNIEEIINKYHVNNSSNNFSLNPYIDIIENCFSAPTVEEILERLKKDDSKWSQKLIKMINFASPTSLKLSLLIIQRGKGLDLADCARMDFRMGYRLLSYGSDMFEGIHTFFGYNKKPQWNPPCLEDVTMDKVKSYFDNLPPEKELKLSNS